MINGVAVAKHSDPFVPLEIDITAMVHDGNNELMVLIEPYPLHLGRSLIPSGNGLTEELAGVWQDCYLVERGEVRTADATIRTSTRTGRFVAALAIDNAGDFTAAVMVSATIRSWSAESNEAVHHADELALPWQHLQIAPLSCGTVAWDVPWSDARWWEPERPHLYWLCIEVTRDGMVIDRYRERFGFREVWIDGPNLMLNDHPVHLASDWGHKVGLWCYSEGWIRQWFGMLRDAHLNHTRLHTHPHPQIVLDLADELGVLITGETAIHGSGNAQAADQPAYWTAARQHLLNFIARDRNRPSVVLWSIENEMRFEREGRALTHRELPELRALALVTDPSRPAYHEGDSSIWNESAQQLISRHYGRLCSGLGWWDQKQPLHSGEMSLHHLNGPNVTLHLANDAGWADYRTTTIAATEDARQTIEGGRTMGVCCLGPWNLSCLENYRRDTSVVHMAWPDWSKPGIKPLVVQPYSSEFTFWKPGPGYTPAPSFAILKQAFRPVAVIDLSQRRSYLVNARIARTLHVVNDGPGNLRGTLLVRIFHAKEVRSEQQWPVVIGRGRRGAFSWNFKLPDTPGEVQYEVSLRDEASVERDAWRISLHVSPNLLDRGQPPIAGSSLAVIGGSPLLHQALTQWGYRIVPVIDPAEAVESESEVLVIGSDAVPAGGEWTPALRSFLHEGGRVVLLDQCHGALPGAELHEKAVSTAFPRAYGHPLLEGISTADLAWWGEDPYAKIDPDHRIARRLYRKGDGSGMMSVIDSGEGGFGDGDLESAAVIEAEEPGGGLILACQLDLSRHLDRIPGAQRLLRNLLLRACSWSPTKPSTSELVPANADALACVERARAGACIVVEGLGPDTISAWAAATGVPLSLREVGPIYQLVRTGDDSVIAGISNADLCGIDNWIYGSASVPVIVADHALAPCTGLEALLTTPTDSLLRELFVHHGRAELLRAHTASRFLFEERAQSAVGLGRVQIGSGQVLFWQFTADDAQRHRCGRVQRRLRRNLGLIPATSILTGDFPAGSDGSPGHPQRLWIHAAGLSETALDQVRDATQRQGDNSFPDGPLKLHAWTELSCPDGAIDAAACGPGRPILLYTRLRSPRERRPADIDLGIPNPDAYTYCALEGDGVAQMTMDSYRFLPTDLSSGKATIQDMAMQVGYNQSVLAWWPKTPNSSLRIRWHNSLMQPETSFGFA